MFNSYLPVLDFLSEAEAEEFPASFLVEQDGVRSEATVDQPLLVVHVRQSVCDLGKQTQASCEYTGVDHVMSVIWGNKHRLAVNILELTTSCL